MYYLLRLLSKLLAFLPAEFLYKTGGAAVKLVFFFWRKKLGCVFRNYKIILSKKFGREPLISEIKAVMKKNFENYGRLNAEFLLIDKILTSGKTFLFKNTDYFDEALKHGRGVVLATLHFANWDIAGITLASRGYKTWALADDLGGGYSKFIEKTREKYGIKIAFPKKRFKEAYESLQKNYIFCILVDNPLSKTDKNSVEIEFFGKKTFVPATAARIALKTGAKVIFGCSIYENGEYIGTPLPPIDFSPSGDENKDIKDLTQEIFKNAEKFITKYPEQWYMFRDFWKENA